MIKLNKSFTKHKNNRKSQIFIVGVVIFVTFGLISAYILLNWLYSSDRDDEHLGVYQSGIVDALIQGDKSLVYIDQVSKYAGDAALNNFAKNGAIDIFSQNGEDASGDKCGKYVYNLWSSETRNCFPDFKNSFSSYYDDELNKRLSTSGNPYLNKKITHKYLYDTEFVKTQVFAIADDNYEFFIFKNQNYVSDKALMEYLVNGQKYSGEFIWPLPNKFSVASCFGYRGISYGTKYHGGLDIPAPVGTPVVAVAPGVVSDIKFPNWGRVEIDHGGGLKTEYLHMNSIDPAIKIGATVSQGQKVGEVGGRGGSGSPNEYDPHLHFAVINSNVDVTLNYQGIPAVIDGNWGKYINPACFISDDYLKKNNIQLNINLQSKSCSQTCDTDGMKCVVDSAVASPFYKFCDIYGTLVKPVSCQNKDNHEWRITNLKINSDKFSGDQTLKIVMSIENDGPDCVSIFAKPRIGIILSPDKPITNYYDPKKSDVSVDVYKKTDAIPFVDTIEYTCTFSTDGDVVREEQAKGNCVLRAPSDDKPFEYTVVDMGVDLKGYQIKPGSFNIGINVTKPVGAPQINTNEIRASAIKLTNSEQARVDKTRANLQNLGILQYIDEISLQNGVPKELVLGVITVESGGDINAASSVAYGLMQVVPSQHKKEIQDPVDGCKDLETYKKDAKCQIRVGIKILKGYYTQYGNKGINFNCARSCMTYSGRQTCQDAVSYSYKSWEAALRAYNSAGCLAQADYSYVDKVLKYASGWGYGVSAQYASTATDDLQKGVVGKYLLKGSFSNDINFDMELIDRLSIFMNKTVNICRLDNVDKKACLLKNIEMYNNDTKDRYDTEKVKALLTTDCESSNNEKNLSLFVQNIEECKASTDFDCQCDINKNILGLPVTIRSSEDLTTFTFVPKISNSNNNLDPIIIDSYSKFYDDSNKIVSEKIINLSTASIYKERAGFKLKVGSTTKICSVVKNKFKLCLKTNFETTSIVKGQPVKENLTIKFAVLIRDNIPPDPVTGLNLENLNHSKNSIIVSWTKNKEGDVAGYNIYLGNAESDFNGKSISQIKQQLPYRSLNIVNGGFTAVNVSISQTFDYPKCLLQGANTDNPYCDFLFEGVIKIGNDTQTQTIKLDMNKLYFIESSNRFFYIINGTDSYNKIVSNKEKFFAVVAFDTDGNEINNTAAPGKIMINNNLKKIKAVDSLEPGLSKMPTFTFKPTNPPQRIMTVMFNQVNFYINNLLMINKATLQYNIYLTSQQCSDGDLAFINKPLNKPLKTVNTVANTDVDISKYTPGKYCLVVTTSMDSKEYNYGIGKSVIVPQSS